MLGKMPRIHFEATTGFEPVIKVLQTSALPLGHVAIFIKEKLIDYWRLLLLAFYNLQSSISNL